LGSVSREDAEDIAADKSLDLVCKIELEVWDPTKRSPSEITGYLSKVARNGLVDRLREAGRWVEIATEDQPEWDPDLSVLETPDDSRKPPDPPSNLLERKEFVATLRRCAEELTPRSRIVWFLRVFCQLSSREIAEHPQVSSRSSHVDVILHRARHALSECMRAKGCEPGDMPPGTFAELWESCRLDKALVSVGVEE
jgi:RNA polymerase sigma factor (sigma-70 family)